MDESKDRRSRIARFVFAIERRGYSPWTAAMAAAWIAGIRIVEEHLLIYVPRDMRRDPLEWFGHVGLFYLGLILGITAWLRISIDRDAKRVLPAVCAGLVLGILPPIVDGLVYGPGGFNYTYQPDLFRSFSPALYNPPDSLPLGETIAVWASVALMMLYARVCGAPWKRVVLTGFGHYGLIILFLVLIPSAAWALQRNVRGISVNEAVSMVLTLACFVAFLSFRRELIYKAVLRLPHVLFAPSLALLGSAVVGRVTGETAVACVAMFFAALAFALQNDFYDRKEDRISGRPLVVDRDDVVQLWLLLIGLWLTLAVGKFWVALAALLFMVVGHGYHGDPHRLKCTFPLSYKSEGFLALLSLGAGILVHPRLPLGLWELAAVLLIAAGASVVAMVKDRKDIEADRGANVRTIYVVLGEQGWCEGHVHRLVLAALVICLVIPPAWLLASRAALVWATGLAALGALAVISHAVIRDRRLGAAVSLLLLNGYIVTAALALA